MSSASDNHVEYATALVIVNGSKGVEASSDIDYQRQLDGTLVATSLPAILDVLHRLLQNTLQFRVRGPSPDENATVISTDWKDSPELVGNDEREIALRQIAYSIRLYRQDNRWTYSIADGVRFRRRRELTWTKEPADSQIFRQVANALNADILKAVADIDAKRGRK